MTPTDLIASTLSNAKTLDESTKWLQRLCSDDCEIRYDGTVVLYDRKHLFDRINGLHVSFRSDEHPPPHFHVKGNGIDASFSITTGEHLVGTLDAKHRRAVTFWFKHSRRLLIDTWNRTRPIDCPVGPIHERDA